MDKLEAKNWKCQDCGADYEDAGSGFCDKCGGLVLPLESLLIGSEKELLLPEMPSSFATGQCGLGILVFDFSSSMGDPAFPEKEMPQRKIDLVAQAFENSMKKMAAIGSPENAYVAVIGFTRDAKLLKFMKASMIDVDYDWKQWIYKQQLKMLEDVGDGTNITAALKLAREIYDSALKGDLRQYGFDDFAPLHHDIVIENEVFSIPNVRVFIYSDGKHTAGHFINYFENASLISGIPNINGVICAYFGTVEEEGFDNLYQVAGTCPRHGTKGIIHIIVPEAFPYIRQIFHMASMASGFCAQCAKESKFSS